jgi:RND family efflux transporter MFP subunit
MNTERQPPNLPTANRLGRTASPSRSVRGALALLAVLCACSRAPAPRTPPALPPKELRVVKADRSLQPVLTEVVGTVRSVHDAAIAALVSGTVSEVRVGLGSSVRAGEVLVRISAHEVDARLEQTRAALAIAKRDRDRAVSLEAQGAITTAQYDAATSEWNVARARDAEASAIVDRTVLRAPFAGVITAKLVNVGETALPGRHLLTLESRAANRFEAEVPEALSAALTAGQRLLVRVEGLDRDLEGRIAEIQPASDDATRARLMKIDLPKAPGLRSGQFGRVLLEIGRAATVTVPSAAVARHGQLETVFIVDSGIARLRLVRSGREMDGRVQISSGLAGGEEVALASATDLVDGQRVEEVR